ncbi:MAG TPA: ABC transporter ATP-binding protein [Streptosporangiaceae bacterium]|nr:ABC transporter ATP-binding protein [Streptosporangiaceae bacterium]
MDDRDLVIQTGGLAKRFGRVLALDGLSLDVRAGEVLGFLGPNGAGKTTTLRLLMGYLRPTAGSARVLGLDSWRDSVAIHARTGYLPGDVRLWPRLSSRQIAGHLARLRGLNHDQRITDLAKRLDVDLDRPVGELSKGNRQKAGVLLALLGDPELLLLDEPTSGLDPLVQAEFHAILRERVEAGAAVMLSSHVLSEVERIADRVAIIRSGRLLMLESLAGLREKARRTVEVRFGSPPPPGAFAAVPGITDVRLDGTLLRCTMQGVVDPLIKALGRYHVLDLNSHEADLEETFLALYGQEEPR